MIILIVSIFLQIWITPGSGCGDAPNVTLNCEDDGFAHVNWTLSDPHCRFDCKAKWICRDAVNASNIHEEESGFGCPFNWTFNTTWDYYFCNVSVYYEYFDWRINANDNSPTTIKSCENFNPVEFIVDMYDTMENLIVGDPYEIKCEISTNLKINSGLVNFTWIGPNNETIVTNNRTNVTTTTSIGKNHTSILQFLYLSENDHGLYTCLVTLLNVTDSAHLELEEASILAPKVSITIPSSHTIGKPTPSPVSPTSKTATSNPPTSDTNPAPTRTTSTASTSESNPEPTISPTSTRSTSATSTSDNNAAIIISSIIAIIMAIGIIIGFIIHCSRKRYLKFTASHPHNEDQMPMPPVPIDDNYTIPYGPEASTIDYEYLKNNDKENKRMKNDLDISTVDEELSSICSPSLTNEKMLDYVMHGSSMKQHAMPMHDIGYCYSTEDHSKNVKTKNDNGYHSGSNESISHENGSYISESAAFHNDGTKETLFSIQEEIPYFNSAAMIEDEELVRSASSEMINSHTTIESHYQKHVQDAIMTGSTKQESYGTKSDQHSSSSFQTSAEEINEDEKSAVKSPVLSEGGYVPYATAKIQLTSSPTLVEDKHWNGDSFIMSENFPCPSTINQHNPTAVEIVSENSHNNSE